MNFAAPAGSLLHHGAAHPHPAFALPAASSHAAGGADRSQRIGLQ